MDSFVVKEHSSEYALAALLTCRDTPTTLKTSTALLCVVCVLASDAVLRKVRIPHLVSEELLVANVGAAIREMCQSFLLRGCAGSFRLARWQREEVLR